MVIAKVSPFRSKVNTSPDTASPATCITFPPTAEIDAAVAEATALPLPTPRDAADIELIEAVIRSEALV